MNARLAAQWASVIHPRLAAAALVLAAIPIVIHLISRRRYRRVRWAAMGFLLAASRRSAKRIRIEQFLLMAVRTIVVVTVGLTVARPYLSSTTILPAGESAMHRVLVVDNSLSMLTADDRGETRFSIASKTAGKLLESFSEGDPISIVSAAAPAKLLARGSYDRRALRDRLGRIAACQSATDVTGALTACMNALDETQVAPGNARIYLISDMARRSWKVSADSPGGEAAALADRLARRARFHVLSCARPDASNMAVVRFVPFSRIVDRTRPVPLIAEVANFGPLPARGCELHVLRGDRIARRLDLPVIEPGVTEAVTFSIAPGDTDELALEVRLNSVAGDGLSIDDRRLLALSIDDAQPILVVEGRRGAGNFDGDAGYFITALAPRLTALDVAPLRPKRISAAELAQEAFEEYRMVVLCNVDSLAPELWSRLEQYVHDGGGLLITAGDELNADNYNTYGHRDGAGLLPALLLAPAWPGQVAGDGVHFAPPEATGGLIGPFAQVPGSSLLRARFERYLAVEIDEARAEVLARFDDGAPAIVAGRFGHGHCGFMTTTVDMSWSNLPAKGDFVSLAQKLVEQLSSLPAAGSNITVGEIYQRLLSPADALLPQQLIDPDGRVSPAEIEGADGRFLVKCRNVSTAGFYRAGPAGSEVMFAANVDPVESDPRPLDRLALAGLLADEFSYTDATETDAGAVSSPAAQELAPRLADLALLLLLCETWMAMRFGAGR